MRAKNLLILAFLLLLWGGSPAQEVTDSLAKPDSVAQVSIRFDTTYVIPAGPVAGSFTESARIQVVDTVAGWARIMVEGWVPVGKVVGRMTTQLPKPVLAGAAELPKAERPQCASKTTSGKQCKRKAKAGSKYCWQHSH